VEVWHAFTRFYLLWWRGSIYPLKFNLPGGGGGSIYPRGFYLPSLKEHLTKHNASDEQRAKARARMLKINENKGIGIEVLDTVTKETTMYSSIRKAALAIGCTHRSVAEAINKFLDEWIEVHAPLVKRRFIVKEKNSLLSKFLGLS
jgi:hypothetical protein